MIINVVIDIDTTDKCADAILGDIAQHVERYNPRVIRGVKATTETKTIIIGS